MDDLGTLRRRLLEARDARQAAIARARSPGRTVVAVSINVPGPDKCPPGAHFLSRLAREALGEKLAARLVADGADALGPWAILAVDRASSAVKHAAVEIETTLPAGRLLDLDVYDSMGRQIDRASIGRPARPCLVCPLPAAECIRVRRHAAEDVSTAASRLRLQILSSALVAGARTELELTPKPGLVDRLDSGSHPDLSFDVMSRSIDLLPAYFDDLLGLGDPLDLRSAVSAGQRAERRMIEAIGSNTHKGYIFLAGLVLLAARSATGRDGLPAHVAALARQILDQRRSAGRSDASPSHGDRARSDHGVGGILHEALEGLPSVFGRGLPALAVGGGPAANHRLMSVLMQSVEDTTALHRCGPDGLARLREDGLELQRQIESGANYVPWLVALNEEYRLIGLTMGGVADCMALCFALRDWFGL